MFFRCLAACILTLAVAAPAFAAEKFKQIPEFSASLAIEDEDGTTRGNIFFAGKKQRLEVKDPDSGEKSIIITRLDKKKIWMLMPSEKMYMEMPVSSQKANPLSDGEDIIKREKLGKETIDGHPCVKEKMTVKYKDGDRDTAYYWTASDLGWPIRVQALDESWTYTYEDIRVGRQDASLFEIPGGYEKMDMEAQAELPDGPRPPAYPDIPEPPSLPEPDYPEPYFPGPPSVPTPW